MPSWWVLKELQEFVVYEAKDASGGICFVGPERCGVEWGVECVCFAGGTVGFSDNCEIVGIM